MEKGNVTLESRYFNCEKMHAKIPRTTCFARQFAPVQGSRRFLFPECGDCSQGKIIAKEYQDMLSGEKEKSIMPDQTKSGNEASEDGARLCKDCGEKPTMSPRSPYCSSCMQKRAIKARMENQKASKRTKKEGATVRAIAHFQGTPKAGTAAIRIDFGKNREVLGAIVRLAEEEMRPLEVQIIYILKSYLKRSEAAL